MGDRITELEKTVLSLTDQISHLIKTIPELKRVLNNWVSLRIEDNENVQNENRQPRMP